jgi:RHS repeat-associated protein
MSDGRKYYSISRLLSVFAGRWTAPSRRTLAVLLPVVLAVAMLPQGAVAGPVTGKPRPPHADAGRGPVSAPVPPSSAPHHGLRAGQRAPVDPPGLRVPAGPNHAPGTAPPPPSAAPRDGGGGTGPQASNLVLLPGLRVADTSHELYFDAPDTGWTQGVVSLFDANDQTTVLHESAFDFAQAVVCNSPAKFCFTLANADGWGLDPAKEYVTTVSLVAPDGTRTTSPFSGRSKPRVLPMPPAIPPEQTRGDLGTGSSGRLDAQPAVRGVGVNTATGAFTQRGVDAVMSSSYTINVQVERTYSSLDTTTGLMGVGWNFGYDARVFPKPGVAGAVVFRAEDGTETTYTLQADGSYAPPPGAFSKLSAVAAGGWTVVTPSQQTLTFDAAGRLLSVKDKRGKGLTLGYDANGLSTVTDAGGRVLTVTVTGGRVSAVALPDGRYVRYTYANDRLRTVRDPDGDVTTYDYDAQGRLTGITDALGHLQLTNAYDPTTGRVSTQTDALGQVTTFTWDAGRHESKVTDPDGAVFFDGYLNNVLQYSQNGNGDTLRKRADANANTQVQADPANHQYEMGHDAGGNVTSQAALTGGAGTPTETSTHDGSNNVLSFTDARGNTTTYTYDQFNELLSVLDPLGNTTRFDYFATGLLHTVTDPLGHVTTYTYDAAGDKTSQADATGARTAYAYDGTGRVVSTTDPRGTAAGADARAFTSTVRYDGEDRVRKSTDPRGHEQEWRYDEAGRLLKFTDANEFQTSYEYDRANQLIAEHDPDGRRTSYAYTPGQRLQRATDGVGDATTYTYNDAGRVKTVTTPRGNVKGASAALFTTTLGYDFNGNKTSESHPYPDGTTATTRYTYDALNHLTSVTDPLGRVTRTGYDAGGNATSTTDPLGNAWTTSYDADNRIQTTADPLGHTTTRHYDAAGHMDAQTTPTGDKTTLGYDAAGRLTSQTTPRGNVVGADPNAFTSHFGYDPAGNRTSVADPLGNTVTTAYDANNNVLKRTDANGHTSRYQYDADNRLVKIVGPDASEEDQATVNGYDRAGHLTSRTNPLGNTLRYTYDAAGRLASTTDELGRTRRYVYDPDGNLTTTLTARATSSKDPTVRADNTITQQFDILDRLINRGLGTSTFYAYGYDAANELTSLADLAGQQTRRYDAAGELTGVARGADTFAYGYDAAGNLTTRSVPGTGAQTLAYDADNRPATLTTPVGATTYSYDADGNLVGTGLPGGSAQQRGYDPAGRLTSLSDAAPGGAVRSAYTIARDPVGNPTRLDTTQGGASHSDAFTFDAANRVTAMCYNTTTCGGATDKLSFRYDLVGNRTSTSRTGLGTGAFTQKYRYDAANELTSTSGGPQGKVEYKYDADGNQIRAGATRTTYDLDNHVTSVDNGSTTTTYGIDAAGNRLAADTAPDKTPPQGGGTVHTGYQWDVNNPVAMLASEQTGNGPARAYTYHPDGSPLSLTSGGDSFLYQPDPFGNTAELTDTAGTVVQQATMIDPYGRFNQSTPGGPTAPDPRLQFQGQYNDPNSGSYHLRARDYTTTSGRFTSVDPLTASAGAPAEASYVYGHDNPLTNTDPSGMGCGIFAVVCNAVSTAASAVVSTVSTVVNTVQSAVSTVVNTAVSVVKNVVSNVATAAKNVANTVVSTTKAVVHQASDVAHAAAHWVGEHKAAIAGIAAGILVGAACEALTAGAGSIGCAALAGAVGSMVEYGVGTPSNQLSLGGFLKAGAFGAVTGALGGVGGKLLGRALAGVAGKVFGKVIGTVEEGAQGAEGAAAGSVEAAGGRALTQGTETEAADGVTGAAARACLHSFAPTTAVLMADGSQRAIKDINVGDQVLAADPTTGRTGARTVTALHSNHDTDLADVTVQNGDAQSGSAGTQVLHTTRHHPFWDDTRGQWVDAAALRPGDHLHTLDGHPETTVAVHVYSGDRQMNDLTVERDHTYYVVAAGQPVLVHNCGPGLNLTYKPGWSADQIAAADAKVASLNSADRLVVTQVTRDGRSAAEVWRAAGRNVPHGSDIDHTIDLQLGGADDLSNMAPLDASVNRSLGRQIASQIQSLGLSPGDVVGRITIGPRY